jgi:hypothetical protein
MKYEFLSDRSNSISYTVISDKGMCGKFMKQGFEVKEETLLITGFILRMIKLKKPACVPRGWSVFDLYRVSPSTPISTLSTRPSSTLTSTASP